MLGHRGCRLGIIKPGLYKMQARAIIEGLRAASPDTPAAWAVIAETLETHDELEAGLDADKLPGAAARTAGALSSSQRILLALK